MKNYGKIILAAGTILCAALTFNSCACAKVEVPYEATDREIIQMAQNEYDSGHADRALQCYETLLMRYGNNTAVYVEGRYEIAHIYLKQKKYDLCEEILTEIIEIYEGSAPGTLPGAYHKLAENDLAKIKK